ncbi:MAG: adenylate cyclase [Alphaproteobacteria bacterium]
MTATTSTATTSTSPRIEALAEPGGISITERVYCDVRGKIDIETEDLGGRELKNLPELVRVYRILTHADDVAAAQRRAREKVQLRYAIMFAAALFIAALGGLAVWQLFGASEPDVLSSPMSAQASIAVPPFANLSSDPDQEYFADGITNDIISDLSKFHDLFVIASNSVFTYKGKGVKASQVARELAVRYILEGSVRKQGEKVRIKAQLIDGTSGQLLWAERFDQIATDIFELQDEITRRIVRTLSVRLTDIERKLAFAKPTSDLKAYEYVLRARALVERSLARDNFKARELFRKAIERDPDYAAAHAGLGWTYFEPVIWGWTGSPQKGMKLAHDLARKALALEPSNIEGRLLLTAVLNIRRQYDLALIEAERAIALNPNDSRSYAEQGAAMVWAGRTDGGILSLETALRFDPNIKPVYSMVLGLAYFLEARYDDATRVLEKNVDRRSENAFDHMVLAATYAQMDQPEKSATAAAAVLRLNPYFLVQDFGPQFRDRADAERVAVGLRKAGLK